MTITVIIAAVVFLIILIIAVVKARRSNKELSSSEMHPDNFKKPDIEFYQKKENK